MKRLVLFVFLIQSVACSLWAATPSIISGVWDRKGTREVSLFQVVSGRLEILSTCYPQEDKTFGFIFNVQQEGFYVIGSGYPQIMRDKYAFYFKPGDNLSVEVNDSTYTLTGQNTEENLAVAHWHHYIYPLEYPSVYFTKMEATYEDFFPALQAYLNRAYEPLPGGTPAFNRSFEQYRTVDFLNTAINFILVPRSASPQKEDYPDFYRNIDLPELTRDDNLLAYPFGAALLSRIFLVKSILGDNPGNKPLIEDMLSEIGSDAVKGELLLQEATTLKTYVGYTDLMEKYGQYLVLPVQKKRAAELAAWLARDENKPGQAAINFAYPDVNGKYVSLFDFKGKMVYVDVWATWCGPCIKEMPHIEKLMDEYKGKDIVFMGVSIDKERDKPKWQNFLKEKKLKGVQVYAGQDSELAKMYQIATIPRFMLFDKKGNIVSTDAPRPSEPELRLMIDKGLRE